jgi:molybdopterin-guanine dinucleotide biosynthesis protein A
LTGAILAGGENRRLPYIKGLLRIDGITIIERNIHILKEVFGRVVISTNSPEIYFPFGAPLIGDIINERGPMTGIFSILMATADEALFVMACDMPFMKKGLIEYMKDRFLSLSSGGIEFDALVPEFNGGLEPLSAIYTSRIRDKLEDSLKRGRKGLHSLLREVDTIYIKEEEIKGIDPEGISFININTLEDLERIGGNRCLV